MMRLLFLYTLCVACIARKRETDLQVEGNVGELERDLQNSAHLSCARSPQFTTIHPSLVYVDRPQSERNMDAILRNFTALGSESRVVRTSISAEEIEVSTHMPVALTGTNMGIGVGLTNGTAKANNFILNKRRVINFLPLQHPRQNGSLCVHLGQLAERGISSFYEHMKPIYKLSHVTIVQNVMLHQEGMVALECGWLQPRLGCANRVLRNGRIWRENITKTIESRTHRSEKHAWQSMTALSNAFDPSLPVYDEVFVINALWDFNFYHFMVESLIRLVRFYHYLQRNPHIKIHIRLEEMMGYNASNENFVLRAERGRAMRTRVLTLLDIPPERVVSGPLLARKLYLPNDMECTSSPRHSMDLRLFSKILVGKAQKSIDTGFCRTPVPTPSHQAFKSLRMNKNTTETSLYLPYVEQLPVHGAQVLVQARTCTGNWRCLNETVAAEVARAAEVVFPRSDVVIANTSLSRGLACDIDLYRSADVVIGVHGAAMTNLMFMRPGTVLVEIVGAYDLRMPPVCGFYGPFAAVFGVHHYIYYYDGVLLNAKLNVLDLLIHSHQFYDDIRAKARYNVYAFPFNK